MTQQPRTPTTEAGRQLLDDAYQGSCRDCFGPFIVNGHRRESHGLVVDIDASAILTIEDQSQADLLAQIEAMSGDAADLTDLMDEAAALRTALGHVLVRTHDSGCGTCDAARALLTADHELLSRAAIRSAAPAEPVTDRLVSVGGAE